MHTTLQTCDGFQFQVGLRAYNTMPYSHIIMMKWAYFILIPENRIGLNGLPRGR